MAKTIKVDIKKLGLMVNKLGYFLLIPKFKAAGTFVTDIGSVKKFPAAVAG